MRIGITVSASLCVSLCLCELQAQGLGTFEMPFGHQNNGVFKFADHEWDNYFVPGVPGTTPWVNCFFPGGSPRFNALHAALIPQDVTINTPSGPESLRGRVLVWTYEIFPATGPLSGPEPYMSRGQHFWSIVDPTQSGNPGYRFMNFRLDGIQSEGRGAGLACAGHTWLEDGRLFVAGGTEKYSGDLDTRIIGSKVSFLFDPSGILGNSMWTKLSAELETRRWYPSCIVDASGNVFVGGGEGDDFLNYNLSVPGTTGWNVLSDTYEMWVRDTSQYEIHTPNLIPTQIFQGPTGARGNPPLLNAELFVYPRMHLLTTGELFMGGMEDQSASVWHDGVGSWGREIWATRGFSGSDRIYGASVLYPHSNGMFRDSVMLFGGSTSPIDHTVIGEPDSGLDAGATKTMQVCTASATSPGCATTGHTWSGIGVCGAYADMKHARIYPDAVLLPDKSVLLIGGNDEAGPVQELERWSQAGWEVLASTNMHRGYHSVALLLSTGKVFIGGGNSRCSDYQIYSPPYLNPSSDVPRPSWEEGTPSMEPADYGQTFTAPFSMSHPGATVEKVVLLRPGSITHHFDADQRYVELAILDSPQGTVTFRMPDFAPGASIPPGTNKPVVAPPGYYMCFLVSTGDIPSEARWVHLQDS